MISIEEALARVLAEARPLEPEDRRLLDARGYVVARDVVAPHDVPPFDNSAMDGYALRSADTAGATPESPASLVVGATIAAGTTATEPIGAGVVAKIMTGAPMPAGADAVVQWEWTEPTDGGVRIPMVIEPGLNVRHAGEDVARGDVVLRPGDVIGPAEIGLLATIGLPVVTVHRRPRVAIISTGSELVEVEEPLGPGQIRNSNSYSLAALCGELGIVPELLGIAPDDYAATRSLFERGLGFDVLLTSGGVSVGEFDFVKDVQADLGVERRLWQVSMKPGKPLVFGVRDRCLVFGVPGNPAAAMVSFELFVRPALLRTMGYRQVERRRHRATLTEETVNRHDRVQVLRVRAWQEGERWYVSSSGAQGSAILRSMVGADGLAFIPPREAPYAVGEEVDLLLLRDPHQERS